MSLKLTAEWEEDQYRLLIPDDHDIVVLTSKDGEAWFEESNYPIDNSKLAYLTIRFEGGPLDGEDY